MQQLIAKFPSIQANFPLSTLNTFQVGGAADFYIKILDLAILPELFIQIKKVQIEHNGKKIPLPYFILGGGSNTIFADAGFRGIIIHLQANKINLIEPDILECQAGALTSQVIQASLKNNLTGLENLIGLPGTIGGAVRGNAGAFGTEIKDLFLKAEIFDPQTAETFIAEKSYFNFSYRFSNLKENPKIITKVWLKLALDFENQNGSNKPQNDPKSVRAHSPNLQKTLEVLKSRSGKQPAGKTAGSFFKNPIFTPGADGLDPDPTHKAGYLLEKAGCKGLRVGQAEVSAVHANWIMNLGGATQNDIATLKTEMQKKVFAKFQIALHPEVQFVSETGMVTE